MSCAIQWRIRMQTSTGFSACCGGFCATKTGILSTSSSSSSGSVFPNRARCLLRCCRIPWISNRGSPRATRPSRRLIPTSAAGVPCLEDQAASHRGRARQPFDRTTRTASIPWPLVGRTCPKTSEMVAPFRAFSKSSPLIRPPPSFFGRLVSWGDLFPLSLFIFIFRTLLPGGLLTLKKTWGKLRTTSPGPIKKRPAAGGGGTWSAQAAELTPRCSPAGCLRRQRGAWRASPKTLGSIGPTR
mmetsp:Transcript_50150/g.113810  ORF Transcript_50150/g.113810 Transcript_50150/m.113810 type:complete len:242 (+) Transcript_50150:1466-2191(+)